VQLLREDFVKTVVGQLLTQWLVQ